MIKLTLPIAILMLSVSSLANAAQWKLSHEINTSETRKVCVYTDKQGNTKSVEVSPLGMNKVHRLRQVEQSKNQYCRTYL